MHNVLTPTWSGRAEQQESCSLTSRVLSTPACCKAYTSTVEWITDCAATVCLLPVDDWLSDMMMSSTRAPQGTVLEQFLFIL